MPPPIVLAVIGLLMNNFGIYLVDVLHHDLGFIPLVVGGCMVGFAISVAEHKNR